MHLRQPLVKFNRRQTLSDGIAYLCIHGYIYDIVYGYIHGIMYVFLNVYNKTLSDGVECVFMHTSIYYVFMHSWIYSW